MESPKSVVLKAVSLPGTGMDEHLARSAFGPAFASRGIDVMAITPSPERLVDGYFDALETASECADRLVLTGISIGAVISVQWALENPTRVAGVIAALPPWTDSPAQAPAALSAAYTAQALRTEGLEPVVAAMRASSPTWLADLVEPAWRAQWPDLPAAMEAVSTYAHPTSGELTRLEVPVALVGAIDDLVHPDHVCDDWAALIPRSAVAKVPLSDIGLDLGLIGHAGIRALESLGVTLRT
jgi:pimeloyl-ACP methyl ester carboxylesterase